jgi:hypothetical protein
LDTFGDAAGTHFVASASQGVGWPTPSNRAGRAGRLNLALLTGINWSNACSLEAADLTRD